MIIIVCLDDNHGMLFNGRRQSRDAVLCQKVLALSAHSKLWMNAYSKTLFGSESDNIQPDEYFLELAGAGEYCFVEDKDVEPFLHKAEKIIIFRWNRIYPSDVKFPMHLLLGKWKKTDELTFPGKSHNEITQEVYLP